MPFTFVRPADTRLLDERPLLDLGTGDGQTLRTLAPDLRDIVATDRSFDVLRSAGVPRVVCAEAGTLPFVDDSFATVLAADLFHHIEDLEAVLSEIRRVLRPDGRLVAWWYERAAHGAPDAPRFPRSFEEVASHWPAARVRALDLEIVIGGGPPTVGLLGRR